ncbi:hypothetical protein SLEP1_g59743 [Rubroshorea leprosula]|uniref:Replication factor A C-terminal domain-containing protein n=1 Tax=Rubroshorea leprosula TaxID=152421 RepID=A0AAV5MWW2_9ROSI|nr:hypothetical protein SLEP1_g59743 [Rubroshorea leprosula]
MGISNTKFNSRIFINNDEIPEILALKGRIPMGEESSGQILSHACSTTYSLDEEFLVAFIRKTIIEIKDCQNVVTCVTLAKITHIESTSNWYYKSCNTCTTGVVSDFGIWYCRNCEKRMKNPRIRYCIQVRVVDETDAASLILFDSAALDCLKKSASELHDLHLKRGGDQEKYPEELDVLKNRKIIFRVNIKKHNINSFEETAYHVGKVCCDDNIILAFLNSNKPSGESFELQNYSFDGDFNNTGKEKIVMEENSHIGDNEDPPNDVQSSLKRSFNCESMEGESDDLLQHSSTKMKKIIKIEKD